MEDKKVQEFHNAYINADKEGLGICSHEGTHIPSYASE